MYTKLYYFAIALLFFALGVNIWSILSTDIHPIIGMILAFVAVISFYFFRYKARGEIKRGK